MGRDTVKVPRCGKGSGGGGKTSVAVGKEGLGCTGWGQVARQGYGVGQAQGLV